MNELDEDAKDSRLAHDAAGGDRTALTELIRRHQRWVYGLALRVTRDPDAAADLSQEAWLKVTTRIAQFQGRSGFRTWAYTIITRTLLNSKRSALHRQTDFVRFGEELDGLESEGASRETERGPEWSLLVEETKSRCMLGMLMCLDLEQRLALVLGGLLLVPSDICAELLGISAEAFRKRLERARRDLTQFMNEKCGLMRAENPCRCPRKTQALIARGVVDATRLRFVSTSLEQATERSWERSNHFETWVEDAGLALMRQVELPSGPDFSQLMQRILDEARGQLTH